MRYDHYLSKAMRIGSTMRKDTAKDGGDTQLPSNLGDDLRLPKLSHLVAARLREQIMSGSFEAGNLLMPESKLLEIFKVSRPTLREALRILESESLISIGRGMRSGAVVLGPNIRKAAEYATFMLVSKGVTLQDLHEARMFFEPAIVKSLDSAKLANLTVELRGYVEAMEQARRDRRFLDVVAGTNRFHAALARGSGNQTIATLVGMLQSISGDAFSVILTRDRDGSSEALPKNIKKTIGAYAALCELLERGKTDEAALFWGRYMERALDFLRRSKLGERLLVHRAGGNGADASGPPEA